MDDMKSKLTLPVSLHIYHGRYAIRDAKGRELFLINVVRPSLEAWADLKKYGEAICEAWNAMLMPVNPVAESNLQEPETNGKTVTPGKRKGK